MKFISIQEYKFIFCRNFLLFCSPEPGESPTLHCADFKVVNCENLNKTLQQTYPHVYKVKVYQHWFCGQTPGMDICYVGCHGFLYVLSCELQIFTLKFFTILR